MEKKMSLMGVGGKIAIVLLIYLVIAVTLDNVFAPDVSHYHRQLRYVAQHRHCGSYNRVFNECGGGAEHDQGA